MAARAAVGRSHRKQRRAAEQHERAQPHLAIVFQKTFLPTPDRCGGLAADASTRRSGRLR